MRQGARRRHAPAAVGIDLETLAPRIPQARTAFGEGRRHRAIERPRFHPALTQRCGHAVGGDAQRPADLHFGDVRRRRQRQGIARVAGQRIDDLKQQRQRGERTVLAGQRRTVRAPHPHADGITTRAADRPGIAKSVTGAGFPGDARTRAAVVLFQFAWTRVGFENLAHDPRRTGRQRAAVDRRIARRIAHATGNAAAIERSVRADQIFQPCAGAAKNQRQIGFAVLRKFQGDAGVIDTRGEPLRTHAVQQIDRRHVQREPQRLRRTDRAVEGFAEISGAVVAEGLRRVDQQTFRMDHAVVDRHAIQERLERGTGRTPGADHVDMAQTRFVAEAQRTDVGARFHRFVVDDQQRRGRAFR